MKLPKTFVPDKDLEKVTEKFLSDDFNAGINKFPDTRLYEHVKNVYEGVEDRNVVVLYGDFHSSRFATSEKTKELLEKEYDLHYTLVFPIDVMASLKYITEKQREIFDKVHKGKKVYVDVLTPDKLDVMTQRHLITMLEDHQARNNAVFVFNSCLNLMGVDSEIFTYADQIYQERGVKPLIDGLKEQIIKQGITLELPYP